MALLKKLPMKAEGVPNRKQNSAVQNKANTKDGKESTHAAVKVTIFDAMAEVQLLQKPIYITNCSQLADQLCRDINCN